MSAQAAKTQIFLAMAASLSLDTAAQVFDTPENLRDKLGDLARLNYVSAEWLVNLAPSAASTGKVLLELMAGATVVDSVTVELATSTGFIREVDLFSVGGAQRLHVRATVDTTDAGKTAALTSMLSVAQPLSVSGC